jgi:hypothetical protein
VHLDAFMQVSRFIEALVLNVARGGPKIKLSLCVEHVCVKLLAGRGPMMRTLQSLITVLPLFLNLNSLTVHTDDWAALFKTGLDSSELAVIVPEKMTTFRLLVSERTTLVCLLSLNLFDAEGPFLRKSDRCSVYEMVSLFSTFDESEARFLDGLAQLAVEERCGYGG